MIRMFIVASILLLQSCQNGSGHGYDLEGPFNYSVTDPPFDDLSPQPEKPMETPES